jgi:hypothetical protein
MGQLRVRLRVRSHDAVQARQGVTVGLSAAPTKSRFSDATAGTRGVPLVPVP